MGNIITGETQKLEKINNKYYRKHDHDKCTNAILCDYEHKKNLPEKFEFK